MVISNVNPLPATNVEGMSLMDDSNQASGCMQPMQKPNLLLEALPALTGFMLFLIDGDSSANEEEITRTTMMAEHKISCIDSK